MARARRPERRQALKRAIDACCRVAVAPSVWTCALDRALPAGEESVFGFWAQTFSLVPGVPGVFLRRAFYRATLERCGGSFHVGFGAFFSTRASTIEDDVYIGPFAIIGSSVLRRGCLIGSRVSILSGGQLHELDAAGRWGPTDHRRRTTVEVGQYAWIGEAAVLMADIGDSAMVAAGSVVSSRIPPRVLVAGNPSRFVKHLITRDVDPEEAASATV